MKLLWAEGQPLWAERLCGGGQNVSIVMGMVTGGNRTQTRLRRDDDRGAGLVEYALLLTLISMASVGALSQLGGSVEETFEDINADVLVVNDCPSWRAAWTNLLDERIEHRNASTWTGRANRDTRIEWVADRDELRAARTELGC